MRHSVDVEYDVWGKQGNSSRLRKHRVRGQRTAPLFRVVGQTKMFGLTFHAHIDDRLTFYRDIQPVNMMMMMMMMMMSVRNEIITWGQAHRGVVTTKASRRRKWEEVPLPIQLGSLAKHHKLPSGVRGSAAANAIFQFQI